MKLYFSDIFDVSEKLLDKHGAFNISLVTDLPLFIDPFLMFHSKKPEYQELHNNIINYLKFLCDRSVAGSIARGLLSYWFTFPEVKQNWLGFSYEGNAGRGLGLDFAHALNRNLAGLFASFGQERITKGTHLEKLCLIREKVGRDNISDFTTNLIKDYLLSYTQLFAEKYIAHELTKKVAIQKVKFDYDTQAWQPSTYTLPFYNNDYVILTPKDILTKDDVWINRGDLTNDFYEVVDAIPNQQLRGQLNNYLEKALSEKITKKEENQILFRLAQEYPVILDYYIKHKEDNGDTAVNKSLDKILFSQKLYVDQFKDFIQFLANNTWFYKLIGNTDDEAHQRILFLKDIIENKGGWRVFYYDGKPIRREDDLHIFFRLTWFATPSDVSREVDDGRGPVDFKISRGSKDKTLVEFKLASNTSLKRNLQNQLEIYEKASDAKIGYKVIFYFSESELKTVQAVLKDLNLLDDKYVILVDARSDNKPSASKATSISPIS